MAALLLMLSLFVPGERYNPSDTSIHFLRERIVFAVHDSACRVDAVYVFSNDGSAPASTIIIYPFPIRPHLPYPVIERIEDATTGSRIPFSRRDSSLIFRLNVAPRTTHSIRIVFDQPAPKRAMEYILSSTRYWKRPLREAEFSLVIPRSLVLSRISYRPTTTVRSATADTVFIRRTNFFPSTNLKFSWRMRP